MNSVKNKTNKKTVYQEEHISELYNSALNKIEQDNKKKLVDKEKKLVRLKQTLEKKLNQKTVHMEAILKLRAEITQLEKDIQSIKSNDEMSEFLLQTSKVIKKQFIDSNKDIPLNQLSDDMRSVEYFIGIKGECGSKQKLLQEYKQAVQGTVSSKFNQEGYSVEEFKCELCDTKGMMYDSVSASISCTECGFSKSWQDPGNNSEWVTTARFTKRYKYKRSSYFANYLDRFQAKENVIIPVELVQRIIGEIKKRRITYNQINPKCIRYILQDLGENDYYDNINTIICKLTGNKAPKLTSAIEHELKFMFGQMQEPFEKHKHLIKNVKHKQRSNFLSYAYTLRKLLRILSVRHDDPLLEKYSKLFKLPKENDRTIEQDCVFKEICRELDWPFFETKL